MKYPNDAKRIKEVCDYLHITSYTLAKNLGYKSPSSIYHVEKGLNQLTTRMATKMISVYPQFDMLYLIGVKTDDVKLVLSKEQIQVREYTSRSESKKNKLRLEINRIRRDIDDLTVQISDMQGDIREVLKIISKQ